VSYHGRNYEQDAGGKMQDKDIVGRRLTQMSFPCKRESTILKNWIPASAGMTNTKKFIFSAKIYIFILFFVCPEPAYSEIYKWTDEKGEVHFTDSPSNIPEQYLNQVQRKHVKETKEKVSLEPSRVKEKETAIEKPAPTPKEETKIKEGVSPDDPNAVIIEGGIKEEATEKKEKVTYSGSAKNNSNTELNSVEIIFTIKGKDGKEESLSLPIKGKKGEGVLESGEAGSFSIQPEMPFPLIAGYGYNFKWRFITGQPK
jgi:hypothetical protein